MGKIKKSPILFSTYFGVDPNELEKSGLLNPALNIDTKLFIDPLLLGASSNKAFSTQSLNNFNKHFSDLILLLSNSKNVGDVAWRAAKIKLDFHEIKGTCLGYSANSTRGSGIGKNLNQEILLTAKQIVDLGIKEPKLFALLALFEDGVGPDRISDMTTNVIQESLAEITEKFCKKHAIRTRKKVINGKEFQLPWYPVERTYVFLVPTDILRELPIAHDWEGVMSAASKNTELRRRVNQLIGNIWGRKTKKIKETLRRDFLQSEETFNTLLSIVKSIPKEHYDITRDKRGVYQWLTAEIDEKYIQKFTPLKSENLTVSDIESVIASIVDCFKNYVENNGLWKLLYEEGSNKPRSESTAQKIFFLVADAYCKSNNIDISPEADSGNGPIDFKFSYGYKHRFLVEIKLSKSSHVLKGYTNQIKAYEEAEQTLHSTYLVIDVGSIGGKRKSLEKIRKENI